MNARTFGRIAVILVLLPSLTAIRGGGGGFSRPSGGFSRPSGGFDMHSEVPTSRSHSSTGPAGTSRTTNVSSNGAGGYSRTTSASNGSYDRTTTGSGNTTTGNYNRSSSGSGPYGSYSTQGSGNAYNHTYSQSGTATNAYGQTYHSSTYANNGTVYHGATVTNPVYAGGAWGWNGGVAWYAAPAYYGGGFWGPYAYGTAAAVAYGTVVAANDAAIASYQVEPLSAGAKLLQSYGLTQTQCGQPNLVVIFGPNNSAICAYPNTTVAAGNYSVNTSTLTLVSEK